MSKREIQNPHVRALSEMGAVLIGDCKLCRANIHSDKAAFWRRAFVRSVCAFIEGMTAPIKNFALQFALKKRPIKVAEVAVLLGQLYFLNRKGEVEQRPFVPPTLSNIAFAFRVYAEALDSRFKLDKSGSGWLALKRTFKVRNRVMHPKNISELNITNREAKSTEEAFVYFFNCLAHLWDESALLKVGKERYIAAGHSWPPRL